MVITATHWSFGFYLAIVFWLGWLGWKQTQTHSDYLLGGRRLTAVSGALSANASDMSGWLLLGLPGLAYNVGFGACWLALGLFIGSWLNWQWVAPRLRATSATHDCLTLPTWFAKHYPEKGTWLRGISAVFILIFFLFYTSAGFVAGAKLFQQIMDIPYLYAVQCCALTIVIYTLFGGFLAVCWSDVFQGILMLLALIAVPIWVFDIIQSSSTLTHQALNRGDLFYFSYDEQGKPFSSIAIISLLAWGLGYFGQPHILARFQALKDGNAVTQGKYIALIWTGLALTGAIFAGVAGAMYFDTPLEDPETVFIALAETLFNPWVSGILLAAVLAAIMSTADSQLLVCTSAISEDILPLVRGKATKTLWVSRFTVVIIAILATLLALKPDSGVLDLVAYAWAGFGATFGPAILCILYWRGTSAAGVLGGLFAGGITVIIWRQMEGGIFGLYEIVPGFILSTITIFGLSYVTLLSRKQAV